MARADTPVATGAGPGVLLGGRTTVAVAEGQARRWQARGNQRSFALERCRGRNRRGPRGRPCVHDLHLAELLGFERPRAIRDLIKRHAARLDSFGPRRTVRRVVNGGAATEYYLNRQQALFITTQSGTEHASLSRNFWYLIRAGIYV